MDARYAGLWIRVKAFALDYLLIAGYLALVALIGMAARRVQPAYLPGLFSNPILGQLTGFLLVTLPVSLYFALCESSAWQATWGKRRLGLRVVDGNGARLSVLRSLARTGVKFLPWELAHTCIWQIQFAPDASSPLILGGFTLVWLLVGVYLLTIHLNQKHQALYDQVVGSYVIGFTAKPQSTQSTQRRL